MSEPFTTNLQLPEWSEDRVLPAEHCRGCEDDFYNGHNDLGVKQCWLRKGAKVEHRYLIPVDMPPPYKRLLPEPLPTCYKAKRHVNVPEEAIDSNGYWRSR